MLCTQQSEALAPMHAGICLGLCLCMLSMLCPAAYARHLQKLTQKPVHPNAYRGSWCGTCSGSWCDACMMIVGSTSRGRQFTRSCMAPGHSAVLVTSSVSAGFCRGIDALLLLALSGGFAQLHAGVCAPLQHGSRQRNRASRHTIKLAAVWHLPACQRCFLVTSMAKAGLLCVTSQRSRSRLGSILRTPFCECFPLVTTDALHHKQFPCVFTGITHKVAGD